MADGGDLQLHNSGAAEEPRVGNPLSSIFRRLLAAPPEIWIFLFYIGVAIFLTWPVILHFNTSIYGHPADNLGTLWINWWYKNAASFGGKASFSHMVGYPFGSSLGFPAEPLGYLYTRFLLLFTGEIAAWNLDILLSFVLSGVTMYYLVRYLVRDRSVAFFAGLAFLMGVFHAAYASYIGGPLAATAWMPLYILCLLKFLKEPRWRTAVFLALTGILVASTSIHYGFFMAVFTVAFLAGRWVYSVIKGASGGGLGHSVRARLQVKRRTAMLSLTVILVIVIGVLPFFYLFVIGYSPPGKWPTSPLPGELRIPKYRAASASTPIQYLAPNTNNPVLGTIGKKIMGTSQGIFGNTSYLGWTILLMALACVFLWRAPKKKKKSEGIDSLEAEAPRFDAARTLWGFAAAGLVAFVLSLKPTITLGSVHIPMPSYLLGIVAPWFRWYNRFAIVVSVCLIVIAAFGLQRLVVRMPRVGRTLLVGILAVFLALEMILVPPFKTLNLEKVPEVFTYVQKLDKGAALAFYPLKQTGPFITSHLMFLQSDFKKPMLNGAMPNSDGEAMRRTVYDPYDPATPATLKRLGISYLVLFEGSVAESGEWPLYSSRLPAGLEKVAHFSGKGLFENASVYRITASLAQVVPLYLGNISIPYLDKAGEITRVLNQEGTVRILNYTGHDQKVEVNMPVYNAFLHKTVTIKLANGKVLLRSVLAKDQIATAEIKNLVVPPQGIDLQITTTGGKHSLNMEELAVFGVLNSSLQLGNVVVTPTS